MKNAIKNLFLSGLMIGFVGVAYNVNAQSSENDAIRTKAAEVEKPRVTTRTEADKAAIDARRNASKSSTQPATDRANHVSRSSKVENGMWQEESSSSKGVGKPSTATRDEKARQQIEARRIHKAEYLKSKKDAQLPTEERKNKRKEATRNGQK